MESITFLDPDGESTTTYSATRSNYSSYNLNFNREGDAGQEHYLANYLYLNPNNFRFSNSDPQYAKITFPSGNYSVINRGSIASQIVQNEDGTRTYDNCRGCDRTQELYGEWNTPDNYRRYVKAWVFPSNLEILSYSSNRNGEWALRHNTLTFYAQDVNNLTFQINFQSRTRNTLSEIDAAIDDDAVQVKEAEDGVRVTVSETVLFQSGSADLQDSGKEVLNRLAQVLKKKEHPVVVEGHTDNIPITGQLSQVYGSNFALAAARSLAVLDHLVSAGLDASRLEARSLGEHRPIADNATAEGRARNRRIEVLIPAQ